MIATLLEEKYTYANNEEGVQELIELINDVLTSQNVFFSHLVIDGQEIYEEHEGYLLDNISNIEDVEVRVQTIKEFVGSLLVSLNTYTKQAIPEIEILVNEFYQTATEESWLKLNQLLDGVGWIYQTIKSIDRTQHNIAGWDEFIKSAATFEAELPNLLVAMENRDSILIADIIQYEILPQFQLIYDGTEKNFAEK